MIGLIPSAGIGKRMRPLSEEMPKALLPVLNRPIIEYVIESMRMADIEDIYVVVNYMKENFRKIKGVRLIEQKILDGTVSAIKLIEKIVHDDFIVIWGDNLFMGKLENLIESHIRSSATATILLDRKQSSTARVFIENERICRIEERPVTKGGFSPAGVYAFRPEIFSYMDRIEKSETGEYEISDLLQILASRNELNYTWIDGWRMNITTPSDLLKANLKLLGKKGADYFTGRNCDINGRIKNSVIGNDVVVEKSCIESSLIMDGVRIENSIVENGIIRRWRIVKDSNIAGSEDLPAIL